MDMVYVSPKNWTIMAVDGRAPEDVLALYPDAKLVSVAHAIQEVEAAIIGSTGGVVRTSKVLFDEAARLRSPDAWVNAGYTESFAMKDRLFGDVTRLYVRIDCQYFTLVERCTLTHIDILKLVAGLLLSEQPAQLESLLPADIAVLPRERQYLQAFKPGSMSRRQRPIDATTMKLNVDSLCNWLTAHRPNHPTRDASAMSLTRLHTYATPAHV